MMNREKEHSCKLVGFKEEANTLVRIKGNIRSLVPNLLIKLFQVPPRGRRSSLDRTTLNSHVLFYSFILVLLVCSTIIFFYKYYILSRSAMSITFLSVHNSYCCNPFVDLNNWYHSCCVTTIYVAYIRRVSLGFGSIHLLFLHWNLQCINFSRRDSLMITST